MLVIIVMKPMLVRVTTILVLWMIFRGRQEAILNANNQPTCYIGASWDKPEYNSHKVCDCYSFLFFIMYSDWYQVYMYVATLISMYLIVSFVPMTMET